MPCIYSEDCLDKLTPDRRSANMKKIRSKDTKPELLVRSIAHSMGYRYRLHAKDLPGKPDLVFRRRRKVIFVHGCFWHQHVNCREGRVPSSRTTYWAEKLSRNQERDRIQVENLKRSGWNVLTVWECGLTDLDSLKQTLLDFLGD